MNPILDRYREDDSKAWWITDGVLERADAAPAQYSIPTGITGEGKVVIPKGVTRIGDAAFYYCLELTSIHIPEGVTHIGKSAFGSCGKLLSAISAKIDYLITNDTDTDSAKNKKAAELGIDVITEDEFLKMAKKASRKASKK